MDVSNVSDPKIVSSIVADSLNLGGALGLAISPDGQLVFATGINSDSVAVVQWKNCMVTLGCLHIKV